MLGRVRVVRGSRHVVLADVGAERADRAGRPQVGRVVVHGDVGQVVGRAAQPAVIGAGSPRGVPGIDVVGVADGARAVEPHAGLLVPVAVRAQERDVGLAGVLDRVFAHPAVDQVGPAREVAADARKGFAQGREVVGRLAVELGVPVGAMRTFETIDAEILAAGNGRAGVDRDQADAIATVDLRKGVAHAGFHQLHPRAVVRVPVGEVGHLLRVGAVRGGGAVGPVGAVPVGRCRRDDVGALELAVARVRVIARPAPLAARAAARAARDCAGAVRIGCGLAPPNDRRKRIRPRRRGRQRAADQVFGRAMLARKDRVVEGVAGAGPRVAERVVRKAVGGRRRVVERVRRIDAVAAAIGRAGGAVAAVLAVDDLRVTGDEIDRVVVAERVLPHRGPRGTEALPRSAVRVYGGEVGRLRVVVDVVERGGVRGRVAFEAVRERAARTAAALVDPRSGHLLRQEASLHAARVVEDEHDVRLDGRRQRIVERLRGDVRRVGRGDREQAGDEEKYGGTHGRLLGKFRRALVARRRDQYTVEHTRAWRS